MSENRVTKKTHTPYRKNMQNATENFISHFYNDAVFRTAVL